MAQQNRNKIKLSQLEKVSKIYQSIKTLDSEIIYFEKMAILMANNKTKLMLKLSVVDLDEQTEQAVFDSDGDLHYIQSDIFRNVYARMFGVHPNQIQTCGQEKLPKIKMQLTETIDDTTGLSILAVILGHKQNQRRDLLAVLKGMGVEV